MSTYRLTCQSKIIPLQRLSLGHQRTSRRGGTTNSNSGRDKSFVYDLNKEPGTVRVRVAFVPRSAEVQPGFSRFDTSTPPPPPLLFHTAYTPSPSHQHTHSHSPPSNRHLLMTNINPNTLSTHTLTLHSSYSYSLTTDVSHALAKPAETPTLSSIC